MNIIARGSKPKRKVTRYLIALASAIVLFPGKEILLARAEPLTFPQADVKISADQLDSLVAPVALYPDGLLSQTLVASTYPLEIIQLRQWLDRNQGLASDQKRLTEAVMKEPWDPSVQALAVLPDVVKRLSDDVQWTTDLGNAFLVQQSDVMDAVQRMRRKAQDKGSLQSNEQQKVVIQTIESKPIVVIEQANPEFVYVPSYNPEYVWGAGMYPYPSIYYPPYYGAWYTGAAISFGLGVAMGWAWGGGWGWGCGWGGGDININRNNNFNRNTNIGGGNRGNIGGGNRGNLGGGNRGNIGGGNRVNPLGGGNKWQHNPSHRGGTPYPDRNTANRFGGNTRGDSLANRQQGARSQIGRQGGNLGSSTRPGGVGNRGSVGSGAGSGNRGSVANRGGVGSAGSGTRGSTASRSGVSSGNRGSTASRSGIGSGSRGSAAGCGGIGSGNRGGASSRGGTGGGDRIGNRSLGNSSSSRGAFGGFSRSDSRTSSSRGSSSISSRGGSRGGFSGGSRGGGGFSGGGRGGGGRGGGGRGGGGGRR